MKKCAEKYSKSPLFLFPSSSTSLISSFSTDRNFDTNLYIPKEKAPYSKLCEFFNKDRVSSWDRKEYLQGIDLLEKCLDLDHKTRITALEALEHPFLNVFDDSQSVTSASNSNNHG
jgi:serine/threonine protein kinase